MVGWHQIPRPHGETLGWQTGRNRPAQLSAWQRCWWQKGARASVRYPLNAVPLTCFVRPVSSFRSPLLTSHQLLNQHWVKPLIGPELSWSNGPGNTLTDTLKCTLKIFCNNFGKQGQGDKPHRFFSEPFLFPNKREKHTLLYWQTNCKIWSLLCEAKSVAVFCRKCGHYDLTLPSRQSPSEWLTGSLCLHRCWCRDWRSPSSTLGCGAFGC